jgi:DNA-binding MarR family transcriptional regulator
MDHYVPYQLALLSSRLAAELESVYRELYGLSRTEWRALALIGETEGCAAAALVERSTMDVVAVHRAVKRLLELGFVERDTAAHDRRLKPCV